MKTRAKPIMDYSFVMCFSMQQSDKLEIEGDQQTITKQRPGYFHPWAAWNVK